MSTNGHLKFQGTNRATFVGETSNIMFDTTTTSLGIGVTGTDHPSSNLYITGNAYVSSNIAVGGVLTMGTVNVVARHDLESVTATGNTTPLTVEFQNATTGIVTTGNVEVGNELTVTGNATVSSNLTVSGNATVSSNLTVSGNVEVGTANLFVDTANSRVGMGTDNPQTLLEIVKAGDPTLRIRDSDIDGKARIQLLETGGYTDGIPRYGTEISYDGDNNKFHISTYDGSTTKRDDLTIVRSTGNVGIREQNPNAWLHNNGDFFIAANSDSWTSTTGKGLYIRYSTNSSQDATYIQSITRSASPTTYHPMYFYGSKYNFNQGNVGIGRTSPGSALDVNGVIKQTGANWALTNTGVSESLQYRGAYPGDYAYLNRTLSTPTNVTLTHENQGGYNTRSRITINTAGKYAMYFNGFRQTTTSGTRELQLHKNGSYYNVRAYSGPEGTTNYSTVGSAYTIMDLNANDYVEVKVEQSSFHGNNSIYFAGHLIA